VRTPTASRPRAPPGGEARPGLEVYLFPAVLGGGLGDLEEVDTAARHLARQGWPLLLYRANGRPLPRGAERGARAVLVHRIGRLRPRAPRALTLSMDWGVTAAPERPGALGRPGPWASESDEIEQRYGPGRVLHVSLGEFARTLTSREQLAERYREGGRPLRWIRDWLSTSSAKREIEETHRLFARFRAFDKPEVLHLFPTFHDPTGFRREFSSAVPTGPLWGEPFQSVGRPRTRSWLWYASPASAARLLPEFSQLGRRLRHPLVILWRSPRDTALPPDSRSLRWRSLPPLERPEWRREFARAGLRIVTGGRSLLEALQVGGPLLYFNGVTGSGRAVRQHRPEKLRSLLRAWRAEGAARPLWHDLSEFARAKNVLAILERAAERPEWSAGFPRRPPAPPYPSPYDSAGALLLRVADRFASGLDAPAVVLAARERQL
jgi:hypothetical protein